MTTAGSYSKPHQCTHRCDRRPNQCEPFLHMTTPLDTYVNSILLLF